MENAPQTLRIPHLGKRTPTSEHASTAEPTSTQDVPVTPVASTQPTGESSTYSSEELFGNHREISIMHRGDRYSLRITSLGRLILTK